MTRYLRQDPIEGWHHITNHAVAGEDLFRIDRDRTEFIRRMNEASDKYVVKVVAFCLMGNHFHLVLYCPNGQLSRFMHYLESVYARDFNMRHGRRLSLFGAPFHNTIIATEGQALVAIRYVHRNPLELGLDIGCYPWSSYPAYVAGASDLLRVDRNVLENLLGGSGEHLHYVETDHPTDKTRLSQGVRQVYLPPPTRLHESLAQLCNIASEIWAVSTQEIVAPRAGVRNPARSAVTLVAYESNVGFAEEIRSILGHRSTAALRTAASRARMRVSSDADFQQRVGELRREWTGFKLAS